MIYASDTFRISENLYCLGPQYLPSYLLDGPEPVLFDAGMSFVGEHYVKELKKILKNRPLRYLLLIHVHFDHCGASTHLKKAYPDLVICGSTQSAEIIQKPSALKVIGELSNIPGINQNQQFEPFLIERILKDEDVIQLEGGTCIRALSVPGHTRDILAFYLEAEKILFPSEAAGVPHHKGVIYTEFLVDSDTYFESQERLNSLSFDTLPFAHNYVYDGEDAKSYFPRSLEEGKQFRVRLSELIDLHGDDFDAIYKDIRREEYDFAEEPKQQESAYLLNMQAKIKAVRKWKQKHQC